MNDFGLISIEICALICFKGGRNSVSIRIYLGRKLRAELILEKVETEKLLSITKDHYNYSANNQFYP